jgi:uncharacterized protein
VCRVRGTGSLVTDLGLRFKFPADLVGIPIGVACQYALIPLYWLVEVLSRNDNLTDEVGESAKDLTDNAHGAGFFILAVLLVVGAPLVEEIFYRGLLQRSLKRYLPVVVSILATGLVFGAAHFSLIGLPGLALFGAVLAWQAHRTGRLGLNIFTHAGFNLLTVLALWAT